MMRLKVIRAFRDKYTEAYYSIGTEMTVEDDRGQELLSNSFGVVELIERIEDEQPEVAVEKRKRTKKA